MEFLKYRRLLPMLVADEHDSGSMFDSMIRYINPKVIFYLDFNDTIDPVLFSSKNLRFDGRKVTVTNVSNRATCSQIQAFFTKFGKVFIKKIYFF